MQELCKYYYLNFGINPLKDKLTWMSLWDSTLVKAQQQQNVTFSIYEKKADSPCTSQSVAKAVAELLAWIT